MALKVVDQLSIANPQLLEAFEELREASDKQIDEQAQSSSIQGTWKNDLKGYASNNISLMKVHNNSFPRELPMSEELGKCKRYAICSQDLWRIADSLGEIDTSHNTMLFSPDFYNKMKRNKHMKTVIQQATLVFDERNSNFKRITTGSQDYYIYEGTLPQSVVDVIYFKKHNNGYRNLVQNIERFVSREGKFERIFFAHNVFKKEDILNTYYYLDYFNGKYFRFPHDLKISQKPSEELLQALQKINLVSDCFETCLQQAPKLRVVSPLDTYEQAVTKVKKIVKDMGLVEQYKKKLENMDNE